MNELATAMRSFVMTGFGEPLREHSAPRPEAAGSEVLLKVDACGVCHSDLHVWEGFFDLGGGRQLDLRPSIALPRALGHEIAGTVVAVGPDVRDIRPGDRRVVFPWIGCGECARCTAGEEHLCAAQRNLGTRRGEAVKRLVGETGGAAAAVEFVGAPSSVGFAMQVLRRGGRLVIVGLMGGSIELQLPLLPVRALSLIGSFVGSLEEMRALVAL